ncbi:MAG TPA: hypothetical protein P5337_10990 [Aestuariivirga sp.]|nr:hypothetical protein [Alphaproteobacteria bacterium]HRX36913.1 hypothetical protein [Aestuariivirga sp.]
MTTKPVNPYLVLAAAVVLPGAGHVVQGKTQRGMMFLFFTIILGWVSLRIMPAEASFFTRHAGGIFIYGLSVIDAYKSARIAWETWAYGQRPAEK